MIFTEMPAPVTDSPLQHAPHHQSLADVRYLKSFGAEILEKLRKKQWGIGCVFSVQRTWPGSCQNTTFWGFKNSKLKKMHWLCFCFDMVLAVLAIGIWVNGNPTTKFSSGPIGWCHHSSAEEGHFNNLKKQWKSSVSNREIYTSTKWGECFIPLKSWISTTLCCLS